jgi:heat shock protein HtpX
MYASQELSEHIRANAIRSGLLLLGFPFILPTIVYVFVLVCAVFLKHPHPGAAAGTALLAALVIMVVATAVWLPIAYIGHQWIIDQATGARLVDRSEERRLWAIYEKLCASAAMRMPALRIIETDVLNAFASGLAEGRYSVTVTRGLLQALDDDELEGVLAHELTHIKNQDVRLLVVATILVGMIPLLHDIIMKAFWALVMGFLKLYQAIFTLFDVPIARVMMTLGYAAMYWAGWVVARGIGLVGYFCSLIIHFTLSRAREFMADAGAVEMTGKPEAMISALRKVSGNCGLETRIEGVREMMFEAPRISGLSGLFATHPPIEKRIQAIAERARNVQPVVDRGGKPTARLQHDLREESTLADPRAAKCRDLLLRVMKGEPGRLSGEQRDEIYRRARQAIENSRIKEPTANEEDVQAALKTLQAVIDEIEAELRPSR